MSTRIVAITLLMFATMPLPVLAQSPVYPDGWVVWSSNREDSRTEIYLARADGTQIRRLTFEGSGMAAWAPDGRWISYMDASNTMVYLIRPDGSENHLLTVGWQVQWLHDNSGLLVADDTGYNIYDPETGEKTLLFSPADFPQFQGTTFQVNSVTHDNRHVLAGSHLFINGYSGANGSFTSEYSAVVLDLLHKDKIYFLGSGCWPFTPPLGDLIFHICADCPSHPDIYRMHLADLDTRASYAPEVAHEDADWGHEYNPRVSNDNRWIAYMASAGCHQGEGCDYDIWLHELGTDPSQRLRVTENPASDGYPQIYIGPSWQPSAPPRLLVTPNRVTFFAGAGGAPQTKLLKLKNSGGGALPAASIATDPMVPWLDITQDSAGITVGVRSGADITRGTHCTNLTITTAGALGSPFALPIVLIADETFAAAEAGVAWDAGLTSEAGWTSEPGGSWDGGAASDVPLSMGLDCDSLVGVNPAANGGVDAGTTIKSSTSEGGCSCHLGKTAAAASPWLFPLVGLAALVRRRRRLTSRP